MARSPAAGQMMIMLASSFSSVEKVRLKLIKFEAVVYKEDAEDDFFNDALTHVPLVKNMFGVTPPARKSAQSDGSFTDEENEV